MGQHTLSEQATGRADAEDREAPSKALEATDGQRLAHRISQPTKGAEALG